MAHSLSAKKRVKQHAKHNKINRARKSQIKTQIKHFEAVLEEGMYSEEGAFRVRVDGMKNGKNTRIECFANAPGLTEAFEKSKITHESYFTGQAAFLFTKMFVNNKITTRGAYPPEVLEAGERSYYFEEAVKLDITVDQNIYSRIK